MTESLVRAVLFPLLVILGDAPRPLCELREAGSRSHEKCSHLPQQCSSDQLPGAFPGFIEKQSGLFGTGWDLSMPSLISWLVSLQWYLQETALTEAKRDHDLFSSVFELADAKGAGSTWQPPELAAPSLSVQMIQSAGHKQTLSCMLFVSLVALDLSVVQRGWIPEALKVTPLVLYPAWILEHLPQPPVCLVLLFTSRPWVGGSSNKTPEVLTAELM